MLHLLCLTIVSQGIDSLGGTYELDVLSQCLKAVLDDFVT